MKKLLLIGDFHIPQRAEKVQEWIITLIKKEKPDLILCTGDLVYTQVLDHLKEFAPLKIVQGNMDFLSFPEKEIIELERVKIGLMHGSGIHPRGNIEKLYKLAKELDVKILVHGHTHKLSVEEYKNILFLNPGSATGVWGGSAGKAEESLIILEIDNEKYKVRKFKKGIEF